MNLVEPAARPIVEPCLTARRHRAPRSFAPLFVADWTRVLFCHYSVAPAALQSHVPFALDVGDGCAWVSVVAFTMGGMRLARGGAAARALLAPVAEQRFLNVRTYVTHQDEPGIYFLVEWQSHRLCVLLGPLLYGLPYRHGRLAYAAAPASGRVAAKDGGAAFAWTMADAPRRFVKAAPGSRDEFLVERYTAFTHWHGRSRLFRIRHAPWPLAPANVVAQDDRLLRATCAWFSAARFRGAHLSPGVGGVWMSRPYRLDSTLPGSAA